MSLKVNLGTMLVFVNSPLSNRYCLANAWNVFVVTFLPNLFLDSTAFSLPKLKYKKEFFALHFDKVETQPVFPTPAEPRIIGLCVLLNIFI